MRSMSTGVGESHRQLRDTNDEGAPPALPMAGLDAVGQADMIGAVRRAPTATKNVADIVTVLVITGVANIALYGYLAVVARGLGPVSYGLFASLFGVVTLAGLVFTSIQTVVAASTARGLVLGEDVGALRTRLLVRLSWAALALAGLLCATSPVTSSFFHSQGLASPIALGVLTAILLPWAGALGLYQGAARFREYSALTLFQAFTRAATAVVLVWTHSIAWLLALAAFSALPPLAVAIRRFGDQSESTAVPGAANNEEPVVTPGPTAASTASRGHYALTLVAVLVISFPTVGDVMLVRHYDNATQAGFYAAVALVGRCVLFIAVAVNAVIYPSMVAGSETDKVRLRNRALMVVGALCGLGTVALGAFPHLSLTVLAGSPYTRDAGLLRTYLLACLSFGIGSPFVYYFLSLCRVRILIGLLVPTLIALVLLPVTVSSDLHVLVSAYAVVSACFLVACITASNFVDAAMTGSCSLKVLTGGRKKAQVQTSREGVAL